MRVINTGLEILDIVNEHKEGAYKTDPNIKGLNMRIGVHTGQVVAGIIGSKIVRYDIFGEGVLVANKMKLNAQDNRVCISNETKRVLEQVPDVANEYYFNEHAKFNVNNYNKTITSYIVERKETKSFNSDLSSAGMD